MAEIKKKAEAGRTAKAPKKARTKKKVVTKRRAESAKKVGIGKRAETERRAKIKAPAEAVKKVEVARSVGATKKAEIKKRTRSRKRATTKNQAKTTGKARVAEPDARNVVEFAPTRDFVPDTSVAAWLTAVATAGGAVSADRVRSIHGLVTSLKDCGVWDRLDRLWVFAAENQAQALVDLVGLGQATAVNEPSFITDLGYAFDGSTQYIDTGFDAAAAPAPRYSRNSASFGGAIFAGATIAGVEFGNDYSTYSMLITRYSNERRFQINSATDSAQKIPHNEVFVGHFHGQRSAENLTELFLDGVLQGSSLEPSSQVPARTFFVGAGRWATGPGNYSNASISTAHVGGSLSPEQVVQFDTAIRTYLNSIAPSPNP